MTCFTALQTKHFFIVWRKTIFLKINTYFRTLYKRTWERCLHLQVTWRKIILFCAHCSILIRMMGCKCFTALLHCCKIIFFVVWRQGKRVMWKTKPKPKQTQTWINETVYCTNLKIQCSKMCCFSFSPPLLGEGLLSSYCFLKAGKSWNNLALNCKVSLLFNIFYLQNVWT